MSVPTGRPSLEEVLNAYAAEVDPGRETLERYIREYPDYVGELVDLSRELSREERPYEASLSAAELGLIEDAWLRHEAAAPRMPADPLGTLSTADLREVAGHFGFPRQVLTALRERRVASISVPDPFLRRLAAKVGGSLEAFRDWLDTSGEPTPARSYKSDSKPAVQEKVSFERILADAGVPPEHRAVLLSNTD